MPPVTVAVIPAAGFGTRQYPATSYLRKEFFALVDRDGYAKPAIQIVVEEALAGGVEEVCIVCGAGTEEACRRHFAPLSDQMRARFDGKEWAFEQSDRLARMADRLSYVTQTPQDGLGHAVWCARERVGDEPFLVLLADHVFVSTTERPCAGQLVDAFDGHSLTALIPAGEEDLSRFGAAAGRMLDGSDRLLEVTGFFEKPSAEAARRCCRIDGLPEGRYLVHFGMHIFTPGVMDVLDEMIRNDERERGEFQLTAAQDALCGREPYFGLIMDGMRYDTGTPPGLLEAQMGLALAGKERSALERAWCRARRAVFDRDGSA